MWGCQSLDSHNCLPPSPQAFIFSFFANPRMSVMVNVNHGRTWKKKKNKGKGSKWECENQSSAIAVYVYVIYYWFCLFCCCNFIYFLNIQLFINDTAICSETKIKVLNIIFKLATKHLVNELKVGEWSYQMFHSSHISPIIYTYIS